MKVLNHYAVKGVMKTQYHDKKHYKDFLSSSFLDSYIHLVLVNIICDNFVLAFNSTMLLQGKDKFSNDHRIFNKR